jgi:uncharacterized membrane protein
VPRTPALVHLSLRNGRWLLPWFSVLLVSAALTYAVNTAVIDSRMTPNRRLVVSVAPAAADLSAENAFAASGDVRAIGHPCASMFGSYNWWLFDSAGRGPCRMEADTAADPPPGR